jgi:hypothetical protein
VLSLGSVTEDPSGSFKTHAGYLHALSYLCGYTEFRRDPNVIASLAARIKAEPSYEALSPRSGLAVDQLKLSLNASWGSELLLEVTGTYSPEELRGVSNTWVAIQAYYACYHATQALAIAKGHPRPTSHRKTQAVFVDLWVTPPRNLAPWSLGAIEKGYRNVPGGHEIDESVHPWAALDSTSAIDLACKALRTTREDLVTEQKKKERQKKQKAKRKAWQEAEAVRLARGRKPRKQPLVPLPRLTPAEHAAVQVRARAFGVLDYLYRLRIKAQYEDSTLFIEGPESASDSFLAYQHLAQLVRSTLLLNELFVERVVGRIIFGQLVDEWIARQGSVPVNPLRDRHRLILP